MIKIAEGIKKFSSSKIALMTYIKQKKYSAIEQQKIYLVFFSLF